MIAATRRTFLQTLGAGILISVTAPSLFAQQRRRGGGGMGGAGARTVAARIHIGNDGVITVMTGKVECGQGARAELTQAAAEELRVAVDQIQLIMADTALVPDDGITAGSGTTPRTVPAIRQGAAAAREMLIDAGAKRLNVPRAEVEARDGKIVHAPSNRSVSYAELARDDLTKSMATTQPSDIAVTPVKQWQVMGTPTPRPNRRDLVTGGHQYPSDIARPGMMYGKVLRPAGFHATLTGIDLGPAQALKDVTVVRDGDFIGVVAPTSFAARGAIELLEKSAKWDVPPQIGSAQLYEHLQQHARGDGLQNPFADELAKSAKTLKQTYHVAYIQHAPMEPRAAVAEWNDGKLTVWTGTQNPFGVRSELARAFSIPAESIRVIVPDFGGGFGGKHSGEAAVEAARLAKGAGKPVSLRWSREEEFTWAYFRPAAVIVAEAGLDADNKLTSWHFVNINSGPSAVKTPYRVVKNNCQFVQSDPPLRHGSYRGLAGTANHFARESFMDELSTAAGMDPLAFRLAHIDDPRLRAVLETAAEQFGWADRVKQKDENIGVGLACGTEKGSYLAACVEAAVDRSKGTIAVRRVVQAFECGAIVNPSNLLSQVQGAIMMGIGPALREAIRFENGKVLTTAFSEYEVPRFADLPQLEVHLIDRPDLPSAGAGETPIMAVAPAIANAVCHATAVRVREMPIVLPRTLSPR
ncbi:MAG TPA: molybdopterin cofactor-binding domain-containing protein [Tepidisphaeraceae bacterium]|nr:molybdopterin cofactor-binding domain-containing protein [Tepidisphaeraceae bacterium]